jgi:hypothetical protein
MKKTSRRAAPLKMKTMRRRFLPKRRALLRNPRKELLMGSLRKHNQQLRRK